MKSGADHEVIKGWLFLGPGMLLASMSKTLEYLLFALTAVRPHHYISMQEEGKAVWWSWLLANLVLCS